MSNTITGIIHKVFNSEVFKNFEKRVFVLKTESKWPQFVPLEAQQGFCAELDKYQQGDKVTVHFDLQGREWTNPETQETKYFITAKAWKIERESAQNLAAPVAPPTQPFDAASFGSDDDLPF